MSTTVTKQPQEAAAIGIGTGAGERIMPVCGIVTVLGILAAGFFSPDPPSHGAAESTVLAFYQQHAAGLLTGAFLWDVAMVALIGFAAALSRACSRAAGGWAEAVRALSAAAAAMFMVSQAVTGAAGVIARNGGPAITVRALDEVAHMTSHLGTLPLGAFILAAGLAQQGARRGGRWIAWLGIAAGAALMLTTSWVAFGRQWLHDAGVVALLAFLVWTLASSVSLLRGKVRA